MIVHRRFPVYEATIPLGTSCEAIRSQADWRFDAGDSFVVTPRKRGPYKLLRPVIRGRLIPNAAGGCDVEFRAVFPPLWWMFDVLMIALVIAELVQGRPGERPMLLLCLGILVFLTFFALPLIGLRFARHLSGSVEA